VIERPYTAQASRGESWALLHNLKKAIQSEDFLTAAIFGMSGLAFAAANVILARAQTVDDYAVFALVIAIITLFAGFGLFGSPVVSRNIPAGCIAHGNPAKVVFVRRQAWTRGIHMIMLSAGNPGH
jgi:hypothetical protein